MASKRKRIFTSMGVEIGNVSSETPITVVVAGGCSMSLYR